MLPWLSALYDSMALTTLPTSWRLAVSACEFCKAGQAIKTTKNIKPAIARTNATSMIVKPLIPPHWVWGWVGKSWSWRCS